MSKQTIDIGVQGNDGTGESIREAFRKVNENFTELYAVFGAEGKILFTSLGDTPQTYGANQVIISNPDGTALAAKDIVGAGGITVDANGTQIVVSSLAAKVVNDPAPQLGGPLDSTTGIGKVPNIDITTNYGADIVTAFNVAHGTRGVNTTVGELAINKNYVDNNFIKVSATGQAIDAIKVRNEPAVPPTGDISYDSTLEGNWLSTEALPRKSVVRRQGDTMAGALFLSDHPDGLAGLGTPQGSDDLQAATKFYVDKNTWASSVNLFVSTTGDDTQSLTPSGKEGRMWNYAYRSVGAAALAAENLINLSNYEPGPYKQKISYTIGPDQYFSTVSTQGFTGGNSTTTGYTDAYNLLLNNKAFIQAEIIAYTNTKYVNKLEYNPDTCARDVRLILDSVSNDLVLGTNYNTRLSARQYYQAVASNVINNQLVQTIDGINHARDLVKNYSYNEVTCSRDVGLILDAVANDMVFSSNFQSIRAGLAYYQASASNVITAELAQTVGALTYIKNQLVQIPAVAAITNAVTSITTNITTIISILENGVSVVPDFQLPASPSTVTGASSAGDLLLGNIKFIQAEVVGFLSANYPTLGYSKETCKRDAKYIVWAVVYDLVYGGNTSSIYAADQYYSNYGRNIANNEVTATVDAINYIKTIAQKIVQNLTPDTVYQQTFRQYKNSSLTGGANIISTMISLFNMMADIVANGMAGHPLSNPSTSGITAGLITAQTAIQTAKATVESGTIDYINSNFNVINDANAISTLYSSFGVITNALDTGLSSLPSLVLTSPDDLPLGYTQAATLIQNNIGFIQDETVGWIAANNPTFTYDGNASGAATCKRDIGYLLEALMYDLTYGGDSASVYAAQQYYAGNTLQVPSNEVAITVAAITYAQLLVSLVITNTAPNTLYSSTSQYVNLSYTQGNVATDDVNTNWNIVKDIIANNTATTISPPDFVRTYQASYVRARTVIQSTKTAVGQSVVDYLSNKYKGGFTYDEGICYRDLGYLVTAAAIDAITGGTYQSINAGKSYYRNTSAKAIAIGTQYTETIDAIKYAKTVALACLTQTSIARYQTLVPQYKNVAYTASQNAINFIANNWDTVTNIIDHGFGAAPTPTFGSGKYQITFNNGGNGFVDQGNTANIDIIPGKVLIGSSSGGNAQIVSYTQGVYTSSNQDTVVVNLLQPIFFTPSENMEYAETVRDLQITIFVESGIYYEDYPIRLNQNVSIKGNDFRRTIIRPRDRVSQSPWRKIFFYRDAVIDGLQIGVIDTSIDYASNTTIYLSATTGKITATLGAGSASRDTIGRIIQVGVGKAQVNSVAGNIINATVVYPFASAGLISAGQWHIYAPSNYGRHYLTNPLDITSQAKNNKDIDVFLVGDATRVNNLSMQGHGGFAMVLDPEGQILSKSPYGQVCSSFSGSLNKQRFAGGQYIDGFVGRLRGVITNVADGGLTVTIKGNVNGGLDVRAPKTPCAFFWLGFRYQINTVLSYDSSTATVVLRLDKNTPWALPITFAYDQAKCSRDVGLIIDAVTYDMVTGSNYQSYKTGLSYLRSYSSVVTTSQKNQTIAGINYARDQAIALIPAYTSQLTTLFADITNVITNGTSSFDPTALTYVNANATTNVNNAKALLVANRSFIRAEIVAWIAVNYDVGQILNYDAAVCSRDVGYLIDALTYDLVYGGNSQTVDVTNAYYNAAGSTTISGEQTVTAAAYTRMKAIVQQIVQNITVTVSSGNAATQITGTPGSASESTTVGGLMDNIINIVQNGVSSGPVVVNPVLTSFNAGLQAGRVTVQSNRSLIQTGTITYLTATYGPVYNINIETGGNRSMLANDFAMINDLGYGIVAKNGGLTEQVSTFTYYCYTHYWAADGGQIRSVAGSNAHGVYALRATGYDVTELPDAVTLANNLTQTAKIYKYSATQAQMNQGDLVIYITNYDTIPEQISELEIDHSLQGKGVVRYEVNSITHTTYYTDLNTINSVVVGTPTKTGTGPYYVTYTLPTQTAPTKGVFYTVNGYPYAQTPAVASTLFGGNYLCTASSTTSITLRYTTDPGTPVVTGYVGTGGTSSSGTTTLTFATQASAPFTIGQTIYTKGFTPIGYNGSWVVTNCTTNSVSFAASVSGGNVTVNGAIGSVIISGQNVLSLNLSTSGNNDTASNGINAALYHQQNIIIKTLQYFKFNDIANVNPTRPSTALQFDDNLASIYRVIAYNLTESTGEQLTIQNGAGQAVLSTDTSFAYYKVYSDPSRITTTDPVQQYWSQFVGSVSGNTLTVTGVTYGTIYVGHQITATGLTSGTTIIAKVGGTGGTGTYTLNVTMPVVTGSISGTTMAITALNNSLPITFGQTISGTNVTSGSTIVSAYTTAKATTAVTSATQTLGSVAIGSNGAFTCTAGTLVTGMAVVITGTLTGTGAISSYASGNVYYIIATNGTTSFTLSSSYGGSAITTTAGTSVGLTFSQYTWTYTTVAQPVPYVVGSQVTVANVTSNNYNGTWYVVGTVSITQFQVYGTSSNANASVQGTVTPVAATGGIGFYTVSTSSTAASTTITTSIATGTAFNEGSRTMGSKLGDTRLAIAPINDQPTKDQINKGTYVVSYGGRIHKVLGYTDTTGSSFSTTATSGDGTTATVSFPVQAVSPFTIGQSVSIIGVTPTSYNGTFTVTGAGTNYVSFTSTAIGPMTVVGQVYGGGVPAFISIDANPVKSNAQDYRDGIVVSSQNFKVGTGPYYVQFNIPSQTWTYELDSWVHFRGAYNTSYNGYYQVVAGPVLTTTGASGDGTTVTLTFSTAGVQPFPTGSVITVAGLTPAAYNGTFTVTGGSATTVTYASTAAGSVTVQGTITQQSTNSTTLITLLYNNDPGTWNSTYTAVISNSPGGIDKPLSTLNGYTYRIGYAQGATAQITTKISTCRATGHDFLDIGTGGYNTTNYPYNIYGNPATSKTGIAGDVYEEGVGRVFHVSTDENGIFRVGRFFTVDQGTGTVTFSASIALSNLDGIGFKRGVVVSEFSTDNTMTNNASDTVPVQSAVRGYIDKRLGLDHGGSQVSSTNKIGPGFLPLSGLLAMNGSLNMANFTIQNVSDPVNSGDGASKNYVDVQVARFDQLSELRDMSITLPSAGNMLVYDTTLSAWKNIAAPTGDVNLTYSSFTGLMTTAIQANKIVNSMVNSAAAIDQSKLNMTAASTRANATGIAQANLGLASFDSANFTSTSGWIGIKASSILKSQMATIGNGAILGNFSGGATNPIEVTAQTVYEQGVFQKHSSTLGAITNGGSLGTITITPITQSGAASSLVQTNSNGQIDVQGLKIGSYTAIGLTSTTFEYTTPGNYKFMTAVGSTSGNTTVTMAATIDNSGGTLKALNITTGAFGTAGTLTGNWSLGSSSTFNASAGTLRSTTLNTGADTTAGTITGNWSLYGNSNINLGTGTINASTGTLKATTLTTGDSATAGTITGSWSVGSNSSIDFTSGTLKATTITTGSVGVGGTLTGAWSMGSSSSITFGTGNLDVRTGTLYSTTLNAGSSGAGGNITGNWSLGSGSRMQASYSDLAEYYSSDQEYAPGTVVVFGGSAEVTTTTIFGNSAVAGVVTTDPAYVMNSELQGTRVCLALQGRVPCKVVGKVKKGDMLTTSAILGHATKAIDPKIGSIIGKALEDKDTSEAGVIEVAVGRL